MGREAISGLMPKAQGQDEPKGGSQTLRDLSGWELSWRRSWLPRRVQLAVYQGLRREEGARPAHRGGDAPDSELSICSASADPPWRSKWHIIPIEVDGKRV